MSARGTAAGIAVGALALWGIWQAAQTEARHPGELQTNSSSLVNTFDGQAGSVTDAAGSGVKHLQSLGTEFGTLAGSLSNAPAPAGQAPAGQ